MVKDHMNVVTVISELDFSGRDKKNNTMVRSAAPSLIKRGARHFS